MINELKEPDYRVVCDYVAGMSDRYAVQKYKEIVIPKAWNWWFLMPSRTSKVRFNPLPFFSKCSTTLILCAQWSNPPGIKLPISTMILMMRCAGILLRRREYRRNTPEFWGTVSGSASTR